MRRIIDSDLWGSKKLRKVPREYQAEYANLLPLADANGVFLYDVDDIHHQVYTFNRPHITLAMVEEMLCHFELAKMLARFSDDPEEHIFGYFVGIGKHGRLPDPKKVRSKFPNFDPTQELHISTLPIYEKLKGHLGAQR